MRIFILLSLGIAFLLSSAVFGQTTASVSSSSKDGTNAGEMRLTRINSITDSLAAKHYFYLKEEGFRIQLPGNFDDYVPSRPASAGIVGSGGQITWMLPEAEIAIMFSDLDVKAFNGFTPEQKIKNLSRALAVVTKEEGTTKISERDLTVGSLPAKEVKYKRGDKEFIARDLLLGSRLFVFVVYPHPVDNAEALVKKALDTFEAIQN